MPQRCDMKGCRSTASMLFNHLYYCRQCWERQTEQMKKNEECFTDGQSILTDILSTAQEA